MKAPLRPVRRVLLSLSLLVALLSCAKAPDRAVPFDPAVEKLFADGFPQTLEKYFCSLGTNPQLGFRWAGTSAERAVGERVVAEMRAMGLANVRLEPVPVDVFEFEKASLTVGGRVMVASTITGVPPTPPGGITAPLVYARGGTAAEFDVAGDVAGKLVLLDVKPSSYWFSLPAFEAAHRGAAGIVCTYSPEDSKYFSVDPSALGSFDGQYDLGAPPWIYVSRRDGDWLKSQLGSAPVTATMLLNEKVTLAQDGGMAFNVVGELAGSRGDGQMVLLAAHQDAHFRAGADDTGGLVAMLAIAKAMRASGYQPRSTVVFLATTGEEFGYTNAYYEWLAGAWWAATHAHPDWAGRVRAMVNLETMAIKGAPLNLRCTPELKPWLEKLASGDSALLPHGSEVVTPVSSWNDQWTFTAAGIPSVKIGTYSDDYDRLYHTNFETSALVDWPYLEKIARFVFRAVERLDGGLLPYSLAARANDLAGTVKKDELLAAGADVAAVARLVIALDKFRRAASDFDRRAATIPAEKIEPANLSLLGVEKALNAGLTALSPADDDATIYPHERVLKDVQGVNAALAALRAASPDTAAAQKALAGTALTHLGILFSYPVYLKHIGRLDPRYGRIAWAGQGQLDRPLDVMPEYREVGAGQVAAAITELESKRFLLTGLLDRRLTEMAELLEQVTPRIESLRAPS